MNRQELLRRISATDFTMWELRIFLDTHPTDQQALRRYEQYKKKRQALVKEYEDCYGPLSVTTNSSETKWKWISSPWPWENEKEVQ